MMINEAHAQATAASGRGDGQYPSGLHDGAEISTAAGGQTKAEVPLTMEAVITRENLMLAYQRVVENKGAAELKPWLKKNWRSVRQVLIDGNYQPRAIRRMDIPKPDGYPEAGWRRENLRHPDGGGQAYPAGDSAAVKRHRGQKLLRLQLRLPAGAQRMAGGATGTALHTGWQTVGGGYGSGEVLRPGGSQTPDDASDQNDKGQAGAETDTQLPESGNG